MNPKSILDSTTTISVPLSKVIGIIAMIATVLGFWYNLKALANENSREILELKEIVTAHSMRLNQNEVNIVEVKTKLDNIQELLVEIKNNIK